MSSRLKYNKYLQKINLIQKGGKQCSICLGDDDEDNDTQEILYTLSCSGNGENKHYFCEICLKHFLEHQLNDPVVIEYWKGNKKIICPNFQSGCRNHLDEETIIRIPSVVKPYLDGCIKLETTVLSNKLAKEYEEKERKAIENIENPQAVELIMKKIDKKCLFPTNAENYKEYPIRCPYCNVPFIDFDGCAAINCMNCRNHFCVICMKKTEDHDLSNKDPYIDAGHYAVNLCMNKLSEEIKRKYNMNSLYYIGQIGNQADVKDKWQKWCQRIIAIDINNHFKTLHKEIILKNFDIILQKIREKNYDNFKEDGIVILSEMVFSHDMDAVHLVRIPNIYWLIYSTKHNVKFEDSVQHATLNQDDRKNIGTAIITEIRRLYPNWRDVKNKVPGETYPAVNYPPEFLGIIAKIIENWGITAGRWNKNPETRIHALPFWTGQQQQDWAMLQQPILHPQQHALNQPDGRGRGRGAFHGFQQPDGRGRGRGAFHGFQQQAQQQAQQQVQQQALAQQAQPQAQFQQPQAQFQQPQFQQPQFPFHPRGRGIGRGRGN
jgi:hypothetical protein